MPQKTAKRYWMITKSIFTSSYNIRLRSFTDWLVVSLIATSILCIPASICIGIAFLFSPKPTDPIWLFMLIPWMGIGPFIPLLIYFRYYRKPRKNDKIINYLLSEVLTDSPVQAGEEETYIFSKNGFIFTMYFETLSFPSSKKGRKFEKKELLILYMAFDYAGSDIPDKQLILESIKVYLRNKPIDKCVIATIHHLSIGLEYKQVSSSDIKEIVSEFIYITTRFHLKPAGL